MTNSQSSGIEELQPGTKVRLRRNPQRVGILGNEWIGSGVRRKILVHFQDGEEEHVLPNELEPVSTKANSADACISSGRYATASNLRMAITHHRLNGRLANLIYSMNTTNTEFFPYQFKPVLQILDSPNNGILIADEVGLGKTIEAGLIWTELRARQNARRLLVICPAMLREKWRDELSYRFGVKAEIVDAAALLDRLQSSRQRPNQDFALIASFQGLRPPAEYSDTALKTWAAKLARFLDESGGSGDQILDMLIFDEAHYMRNPETSTHLLGRLTRQVSEYAVLLSATPIQLGSDDLFNLLKILDESAFPFQYLFERSMQITRPVVQLRDKVLGGKVDQREFCDSIRSALESEFLSDSAQLAALLHNPPTDSELADVRNRSEIADRLDRIHPLSKLVTRTLKRHVHINRVIREVEAWKANLNEIEREFYNRVTEKVRDYCEESGMLTGFILTIPQRQMASSMAAACRAWQDRQRSGKMEGIDDAFYELSHDVDQVYEEVEEEGNLIRELISIAKEVGDYQKLRDNDSKYAELIRSLRGYCKTNPGQKIVLFSFFRQTLNYLHERLKEDSFDSILLMGGMDKQEVLAAFRSENGPQILLSSEVASEGVDLQFSSLLINYDLPWNPAKIEQRIGRIDRIGQQADRILIWNFFYRDTIDDRVYDRLLSRLEIFKQSLGSLETVLGTVISRLTNELLSHKLTKHQEEQRIEQTQLAIAEQKRRNDDLESRAEDLVAHGDFILNKIKAAQDLGRYIRGEDLYVYVSDFLLSNYEGTRLILESDSELLYRCEPSIQLRGDFAEFLQQSDSKGSTRLLAASPLPLLFDNCHGKPSLHFERVVQDHPLVRFVTSKLGAPDQLQSRYPVSAVKLNSTLLPDVGQGDYVFLVRRWSFTGSKIQERLEFLAKRIDSDHIATIEMSEKLINIAALHGEDWSSAGKELPSDKVLDGFDDCRERMTLWYDDAKTAMENENSDRVKLARKLFQERFNTEIVRINERIQNLTATGKTRTIGAEKGKKEVAKRRLDQQLADLQTKEKLSGEDKFVTAGVVRVY